MLISATTGPCKAPGGCAPHKGEIERLLPDLADYEKIRKFSIIGEELTVENGALTPTLKVKKRVLLERYKDVIEAMYR